MMGKLTTQVTRAIKYLCSFHGHAGLAFHAIKIWSSSSTTWKNGSLFGHLCPHGPAEVAALKTGKSERMYFEVILIRFFADPAPKTDALEEDGYRRRRAEMVGKMFTLDFVTCEME